MAYFLALDAGGTKTDFVLADETNELGRVRTGTIKRMRTSADIAEHNLQTALGELTKQASVNLREITRICVGTAGETVPLVTDWIRTALHAHVGGELILVGDVEIALDAAFFGKRGVLVLAGTGSNTAGRSSGGQIVTAGGWGPALADQGSGHSIGHQALRNVFSALDEERETSLLAKILGFWNLDSVPSLVEYANRQPSPDFSKLTKLVVECASEGDPVAAETLQQAGRDLATVASHVIRKVLKVEGNGQQTDVPQVAATGSILQNVLPVRLEMESSLRHIFPEIKILPGVVDPIAGALWRARAGRSSA
ncbi:MAG TPA: BadF/BadG/BcrA/BcrD ATPase family protein [Granulicella sp.]|jgi:N-acetylglucosamine kinase-like BadF-type ATPase